MSFEVKKTMNSVLYNDSCERADADISFVGAVTIDTKVYTIFPYDTWDSLHTTVSLN